MGSPAHIVSVALLTLVGCGSESPPQLTEQSPPPAHDPSSTQQDSPESQASTATSMTLLEYLQQHQRGEVIWIDIESLAHPPGAIRDYWQWERQHQLTPNWTPPQY